MELQDTRQRHPHLNWKIGLAIFLFTWTLTTHGKYSASGDEPHYLMITHSIVVDDDMDVANNYADNDGRFFGHDNLEMGLHAVPAVNGHVRPIHGVGLSVALVPAYYVAQHLAQLPSDGLLAKAKMSRGLFAYSIVSLFLIGLTVLGLVLVYEGLAVVTGPRTAALIVLVAGVSPPIVSHAFLVFPEALALFVTCLTVWLSLKRPGRADHVAVMAVALALGALPWTHQKYAVYVPGLFAILACTRWELARAMSVVARVTVVALFILPQVGLLLWTVRQSGTLGGALTMTGLPFSTEMLKSGALGLLLDRQSGLFAYAPLYCLVPASWYLTRKTTWSFLVPAALLYLPAAAFTIGWWAGFSPAARYLVPMMPLCLVVVASAWRYRPVRMAAIPVLVFQVLIDGVAWQWPRTLWPSDTGENGALNALGVLGRPYGHLLPSMQTGGDLVTALGVLALGIVVSVALVLLSTRRNTDRDPVVRP